MRIKFRAKGTRSEKAKDGKQILVIETDAPPELCRNCKKNPRAIGYGARCKECTDAYGAHEFEENRLRKKIAKQKQ